MKLLNLWNKFEKHNKYEQTYSKCNSFESNWIIYFGVIKVVRKNKIILLLIFKKMSILEFKCIWIKNVRTKTQNVRKLNMYFNGKRVDCKDFKDVSKK